MKSWNLLGTATVLACAALAPAAEAAVVTMLQVRASDTGYSIVYSGGPTGQVSFAGKAKVNLTNATGPVAFDAPLGYTALDGLLSAKEVTNVSVNLTGFQANAAATVNGVLVQQPLGGGTISFVTSTGKTILTGSASSAQISVTPFSGSFFNLTTLNFTGGDLLPYLINPNQGGFSFAITGSDPGSTPTVTADRLDAFTADTAGLVSANIIPEPGLMAMAVIGGAGLLVRRRRNA